MGKKSQTEKVESFENFADAYAALRSSAEALKSLPTEKFDDLLPHVDKAVSAYGFCRKRIEAVKAILEEKETGGT